MTKSNFENLSFDYMPSFNADLISEIQFAKKYFDFIEVTLKNDLRGYNEKYLNRVKRSQKVYDR